MKRQGFLIARLYFFLGLFSHLNALTTDYYQYMQD